MSNRNNLEREARRDREGRVPENVVKAGTNAPGTEGVKENGVRLSRFVSVIFVPKVVAGMLWIKEFHELGLELGDLYIA